MAINKYPRGKKHLFAEIVTAYRKYIGCLIFLGNIVANETYFSRFLSA